MRQLLVTVFFFPMLLFAQRTTPIISEDQLILRSVKQAGTGYLAEIRGVECLGFRIFPVKRIPSYSDGLVLFDSTGNVSLIIPIAVLDYRMEGDTIYCIASASRNSKTVSSAQLFLKKLDRKGNLLSSQEICSVNMDTPNAQFDAVFDDSGNCWAWTTWRGLNTITFNGRQEPCATGTVYRMLYFDRQGKELKHLDISGEKEPIRLDTWDASPSGTGFVFRGEAVRLENDLLIKSPGLVVIRYDVNGDFVRTDQVAGPGVYAESLQLEPTGNYLAATYQGNDDSDAFPQTFISDKPISTTKSPFSDEPVRNVVIARFSPDMKLSWHETFNCPTDTKFNSMSVAGEEIAVSLEYKDTLVVTRTPESGKPFTLYTTTDSGYESSYSYSDDALFFFKPDGKLDLSYPVKGRGSVFVGLFENGIFLHGTFLHSLAVMDREWMHDSKNNVYYLLFMENER
jgi:hypothetical protein